MSTYTSGSISFAGLGSGTDFSALIDGLIDIERSRITKLETWRSSWETKNEKFQDLNTNMLTLMTTLESIDTPNEFLSKAVSCSNESYLTASASAEAQEATYTVEIGNLATNDVLITASGAAALTDSVTATDTDLTFSYAGTSYTISNISAGSSLETLVNIINNHADSRGKIRASTIYDGSVYHLQISGLDLGADNQVVISNTGSLIFQASDFNETQSASNAKIRVNGFPADPDWIERSSNTIDDVITGITLNLKEAHPGTVLQLTSSTDVEQVVKNVRTFVDAVNVIRQQIKDLTAVKKYSSTTTTDNTSTTVTKTDVGSILTGNYGVDIISQNLKNITASLGIGFDYFDPTALTGDRYNALSQVGILTDAQEGSATQGLLVLDEDALREALDDDPNAVAMLFSADHEGSSESTDMSFSSLIPGTTKPGKYEVAITTDGAGISSATINGEPATISGWYITGGADTAASGLSIRLDNHTLNSSYSGVINVKQGKTGELIDELSNLTKPFNEFTHEGGPLAVLQANYSDIMESIDDKIAFEETRIDKMERNLKLKYARLDALLGTYENIQSALTSSIAQLNS